MKHMHHIEMRAALWAMLGIACLASAPTMAGEPAWWTQQKRNCGLPSNLAYNNWDGRCGSAPSGGYRDYEAERRANEALEANNKGIEFSKREDWVKALYWYQAAVDKNPDDEVMRQNLAQAQTRVANEKGEALYHKGDWVNAAASFQEAISKNPYDKNRAGYQSNLDKAKLALQNQAAASNIQESIQNYAQALNASPVSGGNSGGLDFTASVAPPSKPLPSGSSIHVGAQLKSVERHSREALSSPVAEKTFMTPGKADRKMAGEGFDTPGKASGNLVYPDKKQQQIPPSALDRQVPAPAQKDPQIQQSLARYRKLDAQKAETTQKIAAIKEQQKKGTGDAAVLAAQLGTLTYQSKQIDNDQAKVTETVKKQVKNLGFNLVEVAEPTTTEAKKK